MSPTFFPGKLTAIHTLKQFPAFLTLKVHYYIHNTPLWEPVINLIMQYTFTLWNEYETNIEVHIVGYLYIMDLINAQKMEYIKIL